MSAGCSTAFSRCSWRLVMLLAEHVGMFKIGLELFVRSGPELVNWIAKTGSAKVFLDLKFHDIPVTVRRAMARAAELGIFFATVHCGESRAMLEAAGQDWERHLVKCLDGRQIQVHCHYGDCTGAR